MERQWLACTRSKLAGKLAHRTDRGLTVGYIGGSITYGSGASDEATSSWRALTTSWLRGQYPGVAITEIHAAIGGTGSDLGAYRCVHDLLAGQPDLVFVEFAVNDSGQEKEWVQRSMEGLVRRIWSEDGSRDIVFVYAAVKGFSEEYSRGELPSVTGWHQEVADYYCIPSINVGRSLWQAATAGPAGWDELAPDGCHPSDAGYAIYAADVAAFLEEALAPGDDDPDHAPEMILPSPMTVNPLWDGRLVDAWTAAGEGWERREESLCGLYPHTLVAEEPGAELSFSFEGSAVGLYWVIGKDSGAIEWSIDGGDWEDRDCWDSYGALFTRANSTMLAKDLPQGPHELKVRVTGELPGESEGTVIRLGAFLVSGHSPAEYPLEGPSVDFSHGDLRVSENKRYLVHADGTPFFWLGDTAWELIHRLNREEASAYLENRRQKAFTVIQAVVLAEYDGLMAPNPYGDVPLTDSDPTQPVEAYFEHVDFIVETARAKGLVVGLLPTWGDKMGPKMWGMGPEVFTAESARAYGRFLGSRYKSAGNIVWILGGDRPAEEPYKEYWRQMAEGIAEGDGGRHLKTYHPMGYHSSSEWLHNESWLDMNMLQSGHDMRPKANYTMVEADYALAPPKPCLDAEAPYEEHAINWSADNGYFDDADVRMNAYWAVFAGAHGHTYGCHPIWQMYAPGRESVAAARIYWYEAVDLPGAFDMRHLRALMESRPFLSRVPDQSLIVSQRDPEATHAQATRGDGYALIYLPTGEPVRVNLGRAGSPRLLRVWWYSPRTGEATLQGKFPTDGIATFTPPTCGRGNDWVLVLDDAEAGFGAPGAPNDQVTAGK